MQTARRACGMHSAALSYRRWVLVCVVRVGIGTAVEGIFSCDFITCKAHLKHFIRGHTDKHAARPLLSADTARACTGLSAALSYHQRGATRHLTYASAMRIESVILNTRHRPPSKAVVTRPPSYHAP